MEFQIKSWMLTENNNSKFTAESPCNVCCRVLESIETNRNIGQNRFCYKFYYYVITLSLNQELIGNRPSNVTNKNKWKH